MSNCCKRFCVKLTYSMIIAVVFFTGIFFSVDVFLKQMWFHKSKFNMNESTTLRSGSSMAEIRTPIMGLIIGSGYYNYDTMCYSNYFNRTEEFKYYYGPTTTVEVNGIDVEIKCVNSDYVTNKVGDGINNVIFYSTFWCAVIGTVLGAVLLLCVWFCCTGWCRCCCSSEAEYTKLKLVYV
ncbi:Transmembrane_domain-containing protein [Hexamita inflata]|uniref:Transmembrane_domain-containing protein n=1 Tax=Hexamita inflata TaxID=28002 RepID=A0ABP1LMK6_9EUKA